jgi:thiamine biosynthesis lipoprotein
MATRFEIVLHGGSSVALRTAGEAALEEISRLEAQLSLYRPTSEIAHLNARAAKGPVPVSPGLFALLQQAISLHTESGGAFDISMAPLVRCWGFMGGSGHKPDPEALARARESIGSHLIELDPANHTVRFAREGVMLDLGAIGKGYAIEQAADILREGGIESALLHGGTSSIYALGHPPDAPAWKIGIERPPTAGQTAPAFVATVPLRDEAMSVSAIWGRSFESEGVTFGHVLDPRTGRPATAALIAAVITGSGTETDALSTALLVLGAESHDRIASLRPGMRTFLVTGTPEQFEVESRGI